MTSRPQQPVATLAADPGAVIYAEGWQSWSVVAPMPAAAVPHRVTAPESLIIDCQGGVTAPPGVHQGSGLLAVHPGAGAPVEVFAAGDAAQMVPVIQARIHNGAVAITADAAVARYTFAGHGGLVGALGRWADSFAAGAGLVAGTLRPAPAAWCSWYQYYAGVTETHIPANLAALAEQDVPAEVVQIDDGYQAAPGDWLVPSGRFTDLPGLLRRIRASGRRAGIWLAPFLVGGSSALLAKQPEWVVRDPVSGEPVYCGTVCGQRCTALDVTHPGAARYLAGVLAAMRELGADYFKIDFCYAGACEGLRHSGVTPVAAYREGLALIREAIGPEPYLLACGAPILPSVGLVDAMRVGPDIAATIEPAEPNPSLPSQHNATRNVQARAWQQGRFWVNDPDCLMVRPGVEGREAWAAVVERYGGLRASGDGVGELDDWGLEVTRRLLTSGGAGPFAL